MENKRMMNDDELIEINGADRERVNQYDVKVGGCYWIYFPMNENFFSNMPYGDLSGQTRPVCVYEVFEDDGVFFGTNRTVRGIDIETGQKLYVRINHDNVYTMD